MTIDATASPRSSGSRWLRLSGTGWRWPVLVVLAGLALALAGQQQLQSQAQADADAAFKRGLLTASDDVAAHFRIPLYGLNGARSVFAAQPQLNRETFRAVVLSRNLATEFPGVRSFAYVQSVAASELSAFIARERADGAPDFAMQGLAGGVQDPHYVVRYAEPAANSGLALGMDLATQPQLLGAIKQALATGEPSTSGIVSLADDRRGGPGMLMFQPVYANEPSQLEPSQRPLRGLLVAALAVNELHAGLRDAESGQFRLQLFDSASGTSTGSLFFDSASDETQAVHQPRFEAMTVVSLPGRLVSLRVRSTAAFEAQHHTSWPWLFLAGILGASLLMAGLLRQQATSRQRVEVLARAMTADLRRLALVAQRTANAVVITDSQRRITWVNAGFERITGYSAQEVIGQSPGRLLQCAETDPATVQRLREALDLRQGFNGEILNRSKQGRLYWLSLEIQPINDDAGQHIGFMAIELDITERKQGELALQHERRSLANIIEGTQAGAWECDLQSGQMLVNKRWAEIVGYTLAELAPTTCKTRAALTHPDDLNQSTLLLQSYFDGQSEAYEFEMRMRHKGGHWVWVLDRGKLFSRSSDGRPLWMAGTHIDITQRKQAEAALRDSQSFLNRTARLGRIGGWTMDIASQTISWDDETCRIHDLPGGHQPSLEEAIGYYCINARPQMQAAVQRSLDSGEGFDLQLPMNTAAGRPIWARAIGEVEFVDGQAVRLVGALQDVTAQHELADALASKHQLLASVVENLPCGLTVFDSELKLVMANGELAKRLHLPPSLLQPQQSTFEEIVRFNAARGDYGVLNSHEQEACVRALIDRVQGPILPHQFERIGPDGSVLEVRGGPLPGGGFITTYTDISARRRAEEEAQRSSSLLRGAIDALDEAFVLYDPEDRMVLCNERYRDVYPGVADLIKPGVPFETLVRAGAERGDYAEAVGRVEEWVGETMAAHRAANSTVVQPRTDGRTLRIVERKLPDGHIVGFRIDITEIVQATQRVEQASQVASRALARLQAIFDILPVGITLTDPQGQIIDCNPASERLLGISKAEHLARRHDISTWQMQHEDGSLMLPAEFPGVRAQAEGRAIKDALVQVVTPQRRAWLSVSALPVQQAELGLVIAYVDVSEQRAQQQSLVEAKAAAENASLAKSQFLANMSHEIRTPMNAILGMLALLKRTGLTPRQADYSGKTESAARSLLGLLNDILDFSKVEAGKMTLDPQPFRIDRLMRDLGVILSASVGGKPVEVLFDIDHELSGALLGDAMRLQQVLINLGGNALKFTPEGEVVVSVRAVARSTEALTLRFAVRDTGIGIAPENQARIFSGFTQAEASTTRRFGGTGLGVAISQRLVALMGGDLQLDSVPGQGSCFHFTLTLPLAAEGSATAECDDYATVDAGQAAHSNSALPHGMRMLVVDDNATARELLQEMGVGLGWTVDTAADGASALAQLAHATAQGWQHDAVFVDWQMPGLDGWETAQRMRSSGLARHAPLLVMVTAHGREKLEERSTSDQALLDGFLVKPVTASMLRDAVVTARQARADPGSALLAGAAAPAQAARLSGMKLLLVEDNLNNQQVARELLEDEGASVQIANNGLEGVEAVAASELPFDVVLMDLQMPVMDGFTAAARIRQDLGLTALPIVAMTANAMASDREACLAAGMNEHVGKPFDLDRLVALLLRLSGRAAAPAVLAARVAETAACDADRPFELAQAASAARVDLAAALRRLGGKQPVYARLLRGFLADLGTVAATLQSELAAGDRRAAARTLHTFKGLAATLGIAELATGAAQGEQRLALAEPGLGLDDSKMAEVHSTLSVAIAKAGPTLAALLSQLDAQIGAAKALAAPYAAPKQALSPAALRATLTTLAGLLAESDMQATEVVAALREQADAGMDLNMHTDLAALAESVAALDFEHAAELCQRLLMEATA